MHPFDQSQALPPPHFSPRIQQVPGRLSLSTVCFNGESLVGDGLREMWEAESNAARKRKKLEAQVRKRMQSHVPPESTFRMLRIQEL